MPATADREATEGLAELRQLRSQLQELESLAGSHGLWLTATLIGAALESVSEEVMSRTSAPDAKIEAKSLGKFNPHRIVVPRH